MNIKNNVTLKGHHQTLKESKSSVLGDMIGQRHLETVEVECGGEAEFGRGGGVLLKQQKGFTLTYIPLVMTCSSTSKSKLLRGC